MTKKQSGSIFGTVCTSWFGMSSTTSAQEIGHGAGPILTAPQPTLNKTNTINELENVQRPTRDVRTSVER